VWYNPGPVMGRAALEHNPSLTYVSSLSSTSLCRAVINYPIPMRLQHAGAPNASPPSRGKNIHALGYLGAACV
jgi:hypothetical protein